MLTKSTTKALLAILPPIPFKHMKEASLHERLWANLVSARGRLTYEDLCERLWEDDEDGGPLNLENTIGVMVYRLRDTGFKIVNTHGQGFAIA